MRNIKEHAKTGGFDLQELRFKTSYYGTSFGLHTLFGSKYIYRLLRSFQTVHQSSCSGKTRDESQLSLMQYSVELSLYIFREEGDTSKFL
jgi:hypothetical protein